MAILDVQETGESRGASIDGDFRQDYFKTFLVRSSIDTESPEAVQYAEHPTTPNDPGCRIPLIGEPFGADVIDAECVAIEVRQRRDCPDLWEVTARYSSDTGPSDPSPLLRPAEIQWGSDRLTRPVEKAKLRDVRLLNGRGIANARIGKDEAPRNSAGDPFDPVLTRDDFGITLTITRNERTFPAALAERFQMRVNADPIWGFPPRTVRCSAITGSDFWEAGQQYFKVVYQFEVKREGWNYLVLDAGYRAWRDVGGAGKLVEMRDSHGSQLSTPKLLDGEGRELVGDRAAQPDPVFLEYEVYPTDVFAALNLPANVRGGG